MNDLFLRACRGEPTGRVPVWFMRQAGRSLPEYRALKKDHSILELCQNPELATEVTLQPVRRLNVDAAILFSDIVVPLLGTGIALDIKPGLGPVIERPIRTGTDVGRLRPLEPSEDVPHVLETIRSLREELKVPLIGFSGAPFTLASYLVEGGPSRDHRHTKAMMFGAPEVWRALMERLADIVIAYLRAQIDAGAQAIQLFDSWVGALAPADYVAHVQPHSARIFDAIADLEVPRIHFGVTSGELLRGMAAAGPDVVGIDWRVPLDVARQRVGGKPVQGNLDPTVLFAPWPVVEERALDVLRRGGGRSHIFNLGHGVLPQTDPGTLARLVELIQGWEP